MFDVVCIGFGCVDVLVRGVEVNNDIAAVKFDSAGSYLASVVVSHGGDAMNEAITASKLGSRVKLVIGIGNDDSGKYLISSARQAGVDISDIVILDEKETCVSTNLIQESNGERYYFRTEEPFVNYSWNNSVIDGARIVSLGSLFIPPFHDADVVRDTLGYAKSIGAVTCADTKLIENADSLKSMLAIFSDIDYFFPNYDEGVKLTGETDPKRIIVKLLDYGVGNVVLKLGGDGCVYGSAKEVVKIRPIASKMIDSTGAGDSFMGAFMAALASGMTPLDCAKFGNVVASRTIREVGASKGIPSREETLILMKEEYGIS